MVKGASTKFDDVAQRHSLLCPIDCKFVENVSDQHLVGDPGSQFARLVQHKVVPRVENELVSVFYYVPILKGDPATKLLLLPSGDKLSVHKLANCFE